MKKDSDGTRCWQDGLRQASPICAHFKTAGVESSLSLFCMRPLSPACMDLLPSQGRSVSSRQDFYLCFCVPICPSPAALEPAVAWFTDETTAWTCNLQASSAVLLLAALWSLPHDTDPLYRWCLRANVLATILYHGTM